MQPQVLIRPSSQPLACINPNILSRDAGALDERGRKEERRPPVNGACVKTTQILNAA